MFLLAQHVLSLWQSGTNVPSSTWCDSAYLLQVVPDAYVAVLLIGCQDGQHVLELWRVGPSGLSLVVLAALL